MKAIYKVLFITFFLQLGCGKESKDSTILPNSEEYFTWELNSTNVVLTSPNDNFSFFRYGTKTYLTGSSAINKDAIQWIFSSHKTPGTYFNEPYSFSLYMGTKNYSATSIPIQINVTKYGNTGDFIVGSYSGTIQDLDSANNYQVKGHFKIKIY